MTVTSEQIFAIYLTLCFSTPTRSSNDFRPPIEFLYRGHFAYNISEIIIYLGFGRARLKNKKRNFNFSPLFLKIYKASLGFMTPFANIYFSYIAPLPHDTRNISLYYICKIPQNFLKYEFIFVASAKPNKIPYFRYTNT